MTVALMRVAVGMQQLGRMIRAGEVEPSVLWFARSLLGDQAFERLPEEVRAHVLANASASLGTFLAGVEGIEPISEGEIRSITAPRAGGHGCAEPSATHFMHLQNPAAVNAGLLRFLSDVNT